MADMSESAEEIAKYGTDNLDAFLKTGIAARRLGLNIKSIFRDGTS